METAAASARGLTDALSRSQPTVVHRSYNYKNVGDVNVLVSPKDVSRRRGRWALWHFGRPKFSLGWAKDRTGQQLGYGLFAGKCAFPDKCAVCLAEPSRGVVYEMLGNVVKGGSGRYRGKDRRVVIASNMERVWYSVPFCDTHAAKPGGVAFGKTYNDRGWVAFRNPTYRAEFGELNGIQPRGFARRWWAVLLAVAALFLVLGGGIIATVPGMDGTVGDDIAVAAVLLLLGVGMLAYLYITLVVPWRTRRKTGGIAPGPTAVGAHHDRGDGICAFCFEPWPCRAART